MNTSLGVLTSLDFESLTVGKVVFFFSFQNYPDYTILWLYTVGTQ